MRFPSRLTDVWLPLGLFVPTFPAMRGAHPGLTVVARAEAGRQRARARRADMDAIARRLEQQYPASNADHTVLVQPYYDQIVQNIRPALLTLSVAVTLRAADRLRQPRQPDARARRSTAARDRDSRRRSAPTAGGSSSSCSPKAYCWRSAAARSAALLAWWSVRAFVASRPTSVPRIDQVAVDLRVLAFAPLVSVAHRRRLRPCAGLARRIDATC